MTSLALATGVIQSQSATIKNLNFPRFFLNGHRQSRSIFLGFNHKLSCICLMILERHIFMFLTEWKLQVATWKVSGYFVPDYGGSFTILLHLLGESQIVIGAWIPSLNPVHPSNINL